MTGQNTKHKNIFRTRKQTAYKNNKQNTGATTNTNVSRFYFLNVLNQLAPNWHDREWRARNLSRSGQWIARLLLQWLAKILIKEARMISWSDFHVRYRRPTNRNAIRCEKMVYIKRTSLLRQKWDYTVVRQSQEYREQPEFWRSCRKWSQRIFKIPRTHSTVSIRSMSPKGRDQPLETFYRLIVSLFILFISLVILQSCTRTTFQIPIFISTFQLPSKSLPALEVRKRPRVPRHNSYKATMVHSLTHNWHHRQHHYSPEASKSHYYFFHSKPYSPL